MNGANHRMGLVTTYPFNIMETSWKRRTPSTAVLPTDIFVLPDCKKRLEK